jgi:hypothetical protein
MEITVELSLSHDRARSTNPKLTDCRAPLVVGHVRLLHPAVLEERGAAALAPDHLRVIGGHPFVVALVISGVALLFPVFSRPGGGRIEIPTSVRYGHTSWTQRPCFVLRRQPWLAPLPAIEAAARAAGDCSSSASPNRVDVAWLREVL